MKWYTTKRKILLSLKNAIIFISGYKMIKNLEMNISMQLYY